MPSHIDGNGNGGPGVVGVPGMTVAVCKPPTIDRWFMNAVDNFVANGIPYG